MTKRYTVTLGNTTFRKGHRHHCAQVEVSITVEADSPEDAIERVRQMATQHASGFAAGQGRTAVYGAPFRLRFNPDMIGPRSVRVEETAP